jgi:pimeloyl-ACP methyl ester carboxylesterase
MAFFGHSLGSAVATELAEIHPPAALLLQSPFSSARAMARLIVTLPVALVWKSISRIHFDTRVAVATLDVPVSVVHGRRDRIYYWSREPDTTTWPRLPAKNTGVGS